MVRRHQLRVLSVAALAALAACKGERGAEQAAAAPPTFAQACADPSLREAYVAALAARNPLPPYVTSVTYLDDVTARRTIPGLADLPRLPGLVTLNADLSPIAPLGGQAKTRIVILPDGLACGLPGGEEALWLGLFVHEREHARAAWEGPEVMGLGKDELAALPGQVGAWLYDVVGELDAYARELSIAEPRQMPAAYRQMAMGGYLTHYLRLFDAPPEVPRALRDRLLAAWFARWIPAHTTVFYADAKGWRFEIDARVLELPPEVARAIQGRLGDDAPKATPATP